MYIYIYIYIYIYRDESYWARDLDRARVKPYSTMLRAVRRKNKYVYIYIYIYLYIYIYIYCVTVYTLHTVEVVYIQLVNNSITI